MRLGNNNENSNNDEGENEPNNRRNLCLGIRGCLMIVALVVVVLNTIYGYVLPKTEVECIEDKTFSSTNNINEYFRNDLISTQMLLIISSLSVDLIMILLGVIWIVYGKTWRVFIALLLLYTTKLIIQLLFQEKIPEGYLWNYPGFPSIMISYLKTNDFFFCAPVGFLTIACLEFCSLKRFYLFGLCLAILITQIMARIALRGNYIIDLVSAVILAHYIYMLCDENVHYIDNWISLKDKDNPEEKGYDRLPQDIAITPQEEVTHDKVF
jgi:hypothetical protein